MLIRLIFLLLLLFYSMYSFACSGFNCSSASTACADRITGLSATKTDSYLERHPYSCKAVGDSSIGLSAGASLLMTFGCTPGECVYPKQGPCAGECSCPGSHSNATFPDLGYVGQANGVSQMCGGESTDKPAECCTNCDAYPGGCNQFVTDSRSGVLGNEVADAYCKEQDKYSHYVASLTNAAVGECTRGDCAEGTYDANGSELGGECELIDPEDNCTENPSTGQIEGVGCVDFNDCPQKTQCTSGPYEGMLMCNCLPENSGTGPDGEQFPGPDDYECHIVDGDWVCDVNPNPPPDQPNMRCETGPDGAWHCRAENDNSTGERACYEVGGVEVCVDRDLASDPCHGSFKYIYPDSTDICGDAPPTAEEEAERDEKDQDKNAECPPGAERIPACGGTTWTCHLSGTPYYCNDSKIDCSQSDNFKHPDCLKKPIDDTSDLEEGTENINGSLKDLIKANKEGDEGLLDSISDLPGKLLGRFSGDDLPDGDAIVSDEVDSLAGKVLDMSEGYLDDLGEFIDTEMDEPVNQFEEGVINVFLDIIPFTSLSTSCIEPPTINFFGVVFDYKPCKPLQPFRDMFSFFLWVVFIFYVFNTFYQMSLPTNFNSKNTPYF